MMTQNKIDVVITLAVTAFKMATARVATSSKKANGKSSFERKSFVNPNSSFTIHHSKLSGASSLEDMRIAPNAVSLSDFLAIPYNSES